MFKREEDFSTNLYGSITSPRRAFRTEKKVTIWSEDCESSTLQSSEYDSEDEDREYVGECTFSNLVIVFKFISLSIQKLKTFLFPLFRRLNFLAPCNIV